MTEALEWKLAVLRSGPCLCGNPAEQAHHVVYSQHCRKRGIDEYDTRNGIPLCYDCHRRHHNRTAIIPLASLPPAVFEFADEHLGEAAQDYLSRYYGGDT